jgi:hypothetical protein
VRSKRKQYEKEREIEKSLFMLFDYSISECGKDEMD